MKLTVTVAALLLLSAPAFAVNGGSAYSMFGIGDLRMPQNSRSAGLGYTGIGLAWTNSINSVSPAAWTRINHTRLEAGFLYEGFRSTQGTNSLYLARGDFNGALLAIPIATSEGIVFVTGITPFSGVNYNFFTKGSQQGVDYSINHVGSGGIAKAQAGLSYSVTTDFSVGASLNYLFGTIDNELAFLTASGTSTIGRQTEQTTVHGITATVGGLFTNLGMVSTSLQRFSLGFVLSSRGNLKSERQSIYDAQLLSERDSSLLTKSTVTVPLAYGVGLAYQAGERYILAADYYAQPWASAEFHGLESDQIRNSMRVGFGAERQPAREASARWLDKVAYRFGFYYCSTYYKIAGEPVNEWAVTGGLEIPLAGEAHLGIALQYGSRGKNDRILIQEKIFRMSFALSISELWFTRYEED